MQRQGPPVPSVLPLAVSQRILRRWCAQGVAFIIAQNRVKNRMFLTSSLLGLSENLRPTATGNRISYFVRQNNDRKT